jgi:hypothetical protein
MRKVIVLMALCAGFIGMAQSHGDHQRKGGAMSDMTPEQIATLRTKKMALALDLSEAQQAKVQKLNLENATLHKEKMAGYKAKKEKGEFQKPTSDERFAMQNQMLDRALAEQEQMKQILDKDQFEKWQRMKSQSRKHWKEGKRQNASRQDGKA